MTQPPPPRPDGAAGPARPPDERLDRVLGMFLRAGVTLASFVVFAGGVLYLLRHHAEIPDYGRFRGEPDEYKSFVGVLTGTLAGSGRCLIQLGLMLLIATPVLRVAFSAGAFAWQRDWLYTAATLVVLALLAVSLFGVG